MVHRVTDNRVDNHRDTSEYLVHRTGWRITRADVNISRSGQQQPMGYPQQSQPVYVQQGRPGFGGGGGGGVGGGLLGESEWTLVRPTHFLLRYLTRIDWC